MGRGRPKEHGDPKDRFFVGQPRGDTIILEDVTTTGSSLLSAIESLAQIKVRPIAAIGLTNRMEKNDSGIPVCDAIAAKGIPYHAMSNALELLPLACKKQKPNTQIVKSIEKEFQEYGVSPLNLS